MALILTIDGNNRTELLIHESLSINQTNDGLNGTCEFDLIDKDVFRLDAWTVEHTHVETDGDRITGYDVFFPDTKVEVSVVDGAMVYFAGILSRIAMSHLGTTQGFEADEARILHCACHDFNSMLEESVVDEVETYGATLDEAIIDDIFFKYVTGIDYATHVHGGAYVFDEISFDDITVRQVMDIICAQSKCLWYIDHSKKLHYALVEANTVPWHLSDNPDDANSFSYFDDITKEIDATNLVNQVFVVGGPVSLWFVDAASIAEYGEHKAIVRDTSLIDIDDIEARGEAILARHKDPVVSYTLTTYHNEDDLRAGKHIRLVCTLYDVDDTFLINSLTITFPTDDSPEYHIVLGGLESSMSGSAQRLTNDRINDATSHIGAGQLVLSSRGWGHDLSFSADDDDTVEWTAGTITTAGGSSFAIAAGDTDDPGAMVAKTIVYLDTSISETELQMTTDELAAIGANRIMVAVCWPGTPAAGAVLEVKAGFQVFGSSSEGEQTFLNADNIAANSITANEIAANTITAAQILAATITATEMNVATLEAITADMGELTAGTITGGLIRTAASPAARIELNANFLAGYSDAATKQFYLDAATGKAYAGAGAVMLDALGITLNAGVGVSNTIKWKSGADTVAIVRGVDTGAAITQDLILRGDSRANTSQGRVLISATGFGVNANADVYLISADNAAGAQIHFDLGGTALVKIANYDLRVARGLLVGTLGDAPNPSTGQIICSDYLSTDNNTNQWDFRGVNVGAVTVNRYLSIYLNGVEHRIACERM